MHVELGSVLTLDIEKPAVGGRMLARHEGRVVLVWGAIPGERVRARILRIGKGVLYAESSDVLVASSDRRAAPADWHCGGNVFAHIAYERQLRLKAEILRDALGRIGRVPLSEAPHVLASPELGYRMRARLHAHEGRLGFFREGTHQLCDAASTGQLLPETNAWIARVENTIARERLVGLLGVEIAENVRGDERACHVEVRAGADTSRLISLADAGGLTGLSLGRAESLDVEQLAGVPSVSDALHPRKDDATLLQIRRDVRAFFQGNRFLLEPLVHHVVQLVPPGPVVDLYAGVGLFGLSLASAGRGDITLVEGDPIAGSDLKRNAQPFEPRVRVERQSVESFLQMAGPSRGTRPTHMGRLPRRERSEALDPACTFIVDPPRTGMSKEALAGIIRSEPRHVVYVSCDVATFARDTRALLDGGYELEQINGIDLFPNTAHVETVAAFSRAMSG